MNEWSVGVKVKQNTEMRLAGMRRFFYTAKTMAVVIILLIVGKGRFVKENDLV